MTQVLCTECSTEIAPGLLSCPSCARLVHAGRLSVLASAANTAEREENLSGALASWREAIPLLPQGTRQRAAAEQKVAALSQRVGAGAKADGPPWWKRASSLGPVGVAAAVLSKAKFLLLGFTKIGTLLSFLAGFSLYWTLWGWPFALCFLLSIYIHEMGHVAALHRYGIPATPPMFIPALGALVRLKQAPSSPIEDARVGLAGPIYGLCAALTALGIYRATGIEFWAGIAHAGAWLNLFNLLPVWQLDGSRGIRSLDRMQVGGLAVLAAGMWWVVHDGMLLLLAILLAVRTMTKHEEPDDDWTGWMQFAGLIVVLGLLCLIPLPQDSSRANRVV